MEVNMDFLQANFNDKNFEFSKTIFATRSVTCLFMLLVGFHPRKIVFWTFFRIKDPNKSNTQKYFRHSNVKRYELALLRSGYFIYFSLLHHSNRLDDNMTLG